ncbi:MAG: hypothetical protein WBK88_00220 [Methanothrix sp.]|uniref:Uncharacterized protein n=1 Tax=Candidatus Methanocrinis natronophilus TaxID=3033396 RepID=A0ABT5X8F1_9EURY|nr:hypothetical protein [Candidatus Methanocrinis natronophilus]MDF0590862.1 hypothetical protein [Candidatus Methanocrinis natronophilus]
MEEDDLYDLETFLRAAGFEDDEVLQVTYELAAYRSIPGTTLRRYLLRVLNSVEGGCRREFLKGVIVGTAIHEAVLDRDVEAEIDAIVDRRLDEILRDLQIERR